MKRLLILTMLMISVMCSCRVNTPQLSNAAPAYTKQEFTRGVWLTFNEINTMLAAENGFKAQFDSAVENMKELNITDLYFHVRSHCDSVVKSEYFPQTESSKAVDFDILEYAISACKKQNIRLHAWINPYRVNAADSDVNKLDPKSPVLLWLKDQNSENDRNVIIDSGIYLNPAEAEVRKLIINGVTEILEGYEVDGIHFDDYFYPSHDDSFDKISYDTYTSSAKSPLSLADWRRANVTALISACKTIISEKKKDVIFSLSPAADIEKNYNSYYADIIYWAESGYIDEVIPQLYFGFNHTQDRFCFENLLNDWKKSLKGSKARLKIGLATYKIGVSNETDGEEWAENTDIISRQTAICESDSLIDGAVYFSYTSLIKAAEYL